MATSSLGRLTLDLVAKVGNFIEPMSQAERHARRSGQAIADGLNIASLAAKGFGAVMAGVSVAGVTAFASEIITTGNEIKKFSQLSNTSVRDFQFYAKGAETAGISMESFADKMKDMQDRIGDYQQSGGGPLVDFFENIAPLVGVTIQQFQKLSGPQALQLYYDSLQKVGATQNDMKFYMEAIISDSSLLIPLLENGGEGFKKWGEAAERANAIMSDEMIENLALAKENVQMLSLQWDGLKATLVNNVIPVVQLVSNNMNDIKAVTLALTAAIAVKLVPTVVATSIHLVQLAAFSVRAGAGLIGLSASASTTTGAMVALRGAMAFLGGPVGLAMLAAQGVAAGAAFAYMKSSSDSVKPSLDKQGKSVAELVVEYDNLTEAQQRAFKYQEAVELKDLTESYTKAQQQVRAYASSIAEVVAKDEKTKTTVRGWIREFDQNAISAETLANRINKLSSVGEENKSVMDKHAVAATGAKNAMDAQQKVVTALDSAKKGLNQTTNRSITLLTEEQKAYQTLTQKQREALTDLKNQVLRSQNIENNVNAGWSREKAEYVADYREKSGIGYTKQLTSLELRQLEIAFKTQSLNKQREESEKKIAEVKEKQLASQKKMSELVGASALSGLRIKSKESIAGGKVRNFTAEFAKIAQEALGSNLIRFTAFNDLYHKGTNSKHATGNAFDFTVKNAKEASSAVKQLEDLAKRYGFTINAINEYTKPSKRATGGHVHISVLGYKGKSEAIADAKAEVAIVREANEEAAQVRLEILERQKSIHRQYLNEEERMAFENSEAIKEINEAFAGDESARQKYLTLQQAAYEKDIAEYQEAQKQKELSDKRQLLEASRNWMTAGEYAREYYALVREEILNTSEYSPAMKQALIQGSLSQQNLEESYELDSAIEDYRDVMGYGENPLEQQFEVLQKMRELDLLNEEAYQNAKLELQSKSTASYMDGMLGGFAALVDENSRTYAVLFGAQKAFAVAQAMLNIPAAYSKAFDAVVGTPYVGPYIAPAAGAAAAALQVAQAASIKSVNLTGMAHSGIDSVPREGTWLLDKGERVVTSNTSAKLDKTLDRVQQAQSSNTANSPNVNLNPNFVIVDEREKLGDYLYSPDGKKAFVKFFKQNRRELGLA